MKDTIKNPWFWATVVLGVVAWRAARVLSDMGYKP